MRPVLERLLQKVDFERLLSTRAQMRSAHFALHHISGRPLPATTRKNSVAPQDLSTAPVSQLQSAVDNGPAGLWIGCVVPKRHARRAVTRNLLKRQIRASFVRHADQLAGGLWLVRLRAGFVTTEFISARSAALAQAARSELDGLLSRAG